MEVALKFFQCNTGDAGTLARVAACHHRDPPSADINVSPKNIQAAFVSFPHADYSRFDNSEVSEEQF